MDQAGTELPEIRLRLPPSAVATSGYFPLCRLQTQLSNFLRRPRAGSRSVPTSLRLLPCPCPGTEEHPSPGSGRTDPRAVRTASPRPLRPGRVTTAGRPHNEGTGAVRGLTASPQVACSRRLPGPPRACRPVQTSATPSSYQPPDSGIGAREHTPPAEHARLPRPSRERARKARGREWAWSREWAGRRRQADAF